MKTKEKIALIQGSSHYIYDAVLQVCDTHDLENDEMVVKLAREVQLFFEEQCDKLFAEEAA